MPSGSSNNSALLILLCGLPGTGKTTTARKLAECFDGFIVINQNDLRRKYGYKKMPKTFDPVLRDIDAMIAHYLNTDQGVIFDSVNRRSSRRHQIYGIASCCRSNVLTLEVICSEVTAKKRITERAKSDGLLSDPNDPKVYDKLRNDSDPVKIDFLNPGQDHVSYVQFNTENNKLIRKIVGKGMGKIVNKIEKRLKVKNESKV